MSLSAIITEVWPRGSGPQRHNLLVVVGVVLAGEGDLHARAAERAVADDDFAVVLLDDLRRHRQTRPAGAQGIHPLAALEDQLALAFRDPRAVVVDDDGEVFSECSEVISTNSRQYLQAFSNTLPITSIKSFFSPMKVTSGEMSSVIATPLR